MFFCSVIFYTANYPFLLLYSYALFCLGLYSLHCVIEVKREWRAEHNVEQRVVRRELRLQKHTIHQEHTYLHVFTRYTPPYSTVRLVSLSSPPLYTPFFTQLSTVQSGLSRRLAQRATRDFESFAGVDTVYSCVLLHPPGRRNMWIESF